MTLNFDFNEVVTIDKSIQNTVYGYVHRCQALFPADNPYYNISKLIIYIILFYFNEGDTFEINNESTFNFINNEHKYAYHIFGAKRVRRKYVKEYEWKIKIEDSDTEKYHCRYGGTIGIIDDTKNGSSKIRQGHNLEHYKDAIVVGSNSGNWPGTIYGDTQWSTDVTRFIQANDTITIKVNFVDNSVCFTSKKQDKSATRKLKKETKIIRVVVEFGGGDCTVSFI